MAISTFGCLVRTLTFCALVCAPLLGVERGSELVSPFYGSLEQAIPIEVPMFRGLEPRLALAYSSEGGSGTTGTGFRLGGFGEIVRVNEGRGAPRWTTADIHLLDGQEVLPCGPGIDSASCSAGGTHFTKVESYQRIRLDPATRRWIVTDKSGRTTVFSPLIEAPVGTLRWGVSEVADTLDNRVTYHWQVLEGTAYPSHVTFGPYQVTAFWEPRPDPLVTATGVELATVAKRLRSIFVWAPGVAHIRAYRLEYSVSLVTGRSLLTAVQQFGSDVTHDGAGAITGGTSLPAVRFEYTADPAARSFVSQTDPLGSLWCAGRKLLLGDFDGSGLTDQLCYDATARTAAVRLANGTGFAAPVTWAENAALDRPLIADFNADGRDDLAHHVAWYGEYHVALSTGAAFGPMSLWGTAGAADPNGVPRDCRGHYTTGGTGDFNGDGLLDVSCRMGDSVNPGNGGDTLIGLSNGSAFQFGYWGDLGCDASAFSRTAAMDFDGDGKDDWLCIGSVTGYLHVYVSTGSGFTAPSYGGLGPGFCQNGAEHVMGDLNGDGRTDVACPGNGKVALSTGRHFVEQGTFGHVCDSDSQAIALDVDGDRAAELVCNVVGAPSNDILVRKWHAGALGPAMVWRANWCDGRVLPGDFDGDSKSDLLCETQPQAAIAGTSTRVADLLRSRAGSMGSRLTVEYRPSSRFPAINAPPVRQVVVSQTVSDGRGTEATTSFAYEGALMDRRRRQFLGFRKVDRTLPCLSGESSCPVERTWMLQEPWLGARVERTERLDGAGRLLVASEQRHDSRLDALPYRSLLAEQTSYRFDSGSSPCTGWPCAHGTRTRTLFQYDEWGNPVARVDHGDLDIPGDEVLSLWRYRPNTIDYLVDRAASYEIRRGTEVQGDLLRRSRILYDGATSWEQAPIDGLPTTESNWFDGTGGSVDRHVAYDAWGNAIRVTDETGQSTTTTYDAEHHIFPVGVLNAAGEGGSFQWHFVCNSIREVQDANGIPRTTQYDPLCRTVQSTGALGSFSSSSYVALGDPATQHVRIEAPLSTGGAPAIAWERRYFDGFGRIYRTESNGPDAGTTIVSEQRFDPRGNLFASALPRFGGTPALETTFAFDALDRTVRVVLPDGTTAATVYAHDRDTSVDPLGRESVRRFDAFGRVVATARMFDGQLLETSYGYSPLGQLVEMVDPVGNSWAWTFDSLGRMTEQDDPDSGFATFEYDAAGKLTARTDAKGQRTEFEYDLAGRVLRRASGSGIVSFGYGEPGGPEHANVARLTSISDSSGQLRFRYDALGRQVHQRRGVGGFEYVMERRFGPDGRLLGTTYPDGEVVGSAQNPLRYDFAGRLSSVPGFLHSVRYDAAGRPVTMSRTNGTSTSWSYSPTRGWLDSTTTVGNAETILHLEYEHDALGRVTSVSSPFPLENWRYEYDELGRLVLAHNPVQPDQSEAFVFDEIGNLVESSRVGVLEYPPSGSPRPHAPIRVDGKQLRYDANGNRVSGRGSSIQWNSENLPVTIDGTTFTYDGAGARLAKTSPRGVRTLYPLGDDYEVRGSTATKYVSLPGLGVVGKRVGGESFWMMQDGLGSIQGVVDAQADVVQRRGYRPFGQTIESTTAHTESRGWIDQREDSETGLTYLHARYYDSGIGQFISPDPLHPATPGVGTNRYLYGFGDPVNGADRSGLLIGRPICHVAPGGRELYCPWGEYFYDGYSWAPIPRFNEMTTVVDSIPPPSPPLQSRLPDRTERDESEPKGGGGPAGGDSGGGTGGTGDDGQGKEAEVPVEQLPATPEETKKKIRSAIGEGSDAVVRAAATLLEEAGKADLKRLTDHTLGRIGTGFEASECFAAPSVLGCADAAVGAAEHAAGLASEATGRALPGAGFFRVWWQFEVARFLAEYTAEPMYRSAMSDAYIFLGVQRGVLNSNNYIEVHGRLP